MYNNNLTEEVGSWLFHLAKQFNPHVSHADMLRLDIQGGGDALIWITIHTLTLLWEHRKAGKITNVRAFVATLSATLKILCETQHRGLALEALELIHI